MSLLTLNSLNNNLPALGRRKHFQSCQVEGGITHSHPASSKTGLSNQTEHVNSNFTFTIIRNDFSLNH